MNNFFITQQYHYTIHIANKSILLLLLVATLDCADQRTSLDVKSKAFKFCLSTKVGGLSMLNSSLVILGGIVRCLPSMILN